LARFEARCAWCGTVPLLPDQLEVRVRGGHEALFEFTCPRCARLNVRGLERRDVAALEAVGVEPVSGPGPFELLEQHAGPPIGWDDIIDLHQAWFRRGLRGVESKSDGTAAPARRLDREAA
jgi:hypothetical protein